MKENYVIEGIYEDEETKELYIYESYAEAFSFLFENMDFWDEKISEEYVLSEIKKIKKLKR